MSVGFSDVAGNQNWQRIGSTRSTRSNVSSVSSSVSTLQCSADPVEVIKYFIPGMTGNKICLWFDVGPAEDFDNLPGAAKKSLYAGAGLYLRFLCGHCIVLCPSSDIFYLALERIEFEYK